MKAFTSLAIVAAAALSVVAAQEVAANEERLDYSEPIGSTVWNSPGTATVKWSKPCNAKNDKDLDISLYIGSQANPQLQELVPIPFIGKLNCVKNNEATVTLPAGLKSSRYYSIHADTYPNRAFSAHFVINGEGALEPEGGSGSNPGTGAPGTGAPGTGAPGTGAPGTGAPGTGAPGTGAPGTGAPGTPSNGQSAASSLKTLGSYAAVLAAAVGISLL
ncbi:hypothetical protein BGX31_005976 [Mortierella sp. GBA43]|nr:hypothetical protein BGX31_005976 [Mortierella sp. GBA43]